MRAFFIYDERLSWKGFREDHPLQPSRLHYLFELLKAYALLEKDSLLPPRPATEEELLSFHTKDYIEAVQSISRGEKRFNPIAYNFSEYGDNPPYPGMYEAAILPVGGSLIAAELLAQDKADVVFNPSGGLHHAAPNYASGFCIFNDVVIAIKYLLKQGMRVAYIDIDAHHGDGVQNAFYDSNKVLTISLHEWGRFLFPGTGEVEEIGIGEGKGYSVNIPLYPFTTDDIYLWAFREIVPPLIKSFSPDIIVSQLGCDTHYLDPLTHLSLTTRGYSQVIKEIKGMASRWLALGGGGYDIGAVVRCWTLAYGIMVGKELPDEIPQSFQQSFGIKYLHDHKPPPIEERAYHQALTFAQRKVETLKKLLSPFHKL